jgi:lipopolysaccharide biosynthesis glycosyltransferase
MSDKCDGLSLPSHISSATYYRLYIPELIDESKVLYLDSDIVVDGPISDLYETDIDDYYLAAVTDPGMTRNETLGMASDSKYFNAGVLLLNLPMWRRDRIKDRVIDFVDKNPSLILWCDQDGLNAIIDGRWKELHLRYNLHERFYQNGLILQLSDSHQEQLGSALAAPTIIHYTGSDKPWMAGNRHPLRARYWRYLRKTPFYHLFPKNTAVYLLKKYLPESVQERLKNVMRKKHNSLH